MTSAIVPLLSVLCGVCFVSTGASFNPSEAYVTLLGSQHKALADQITTVSKMRVGDKAGSLSLSDMGKIDHAIQVQCVHLLRVTRVDWKTGKINRNRPL